MNEKEVLDLLRQVGAIITGSHFVLTSQKHSDTYVNKDAVYPHTDCVSRLCGELADRFAPAMPEVVIAPAIGGVILAQWTAHFLSARYTTQKVLGIYAEKGTTVIPDPENNGRHCFAETGSFVIKRNYDKLVKDKRVLVVEDILTTGGSAKRVIEAVRAIGGNVVSVGVLCNRGGITPADLANVPRLEALVNIKLDSWSEDECPLCKARVPVNTNIGKGREFLTRVKKS